jgi:EAL domain-containing protein (putative c-di-GMP-specific phosphodiesterase class I)
MSARAISRIELEDDLRRAIAEQQFVLHFQANVDTHTEKTVSAEALVRWQHPVKGLVDPEQFMPLAEETGLICEIGQLALASACEHARVWQRDGYEPISIAVNLSAAQFEQADLIDNVMECLVASNLDSHWLRLELTEEALLRNADHAREALYRLRELGITIAIDDFGTGYTSLIQAFIPNLPDTREEASLLEAIVALGRKLNLSLLAEGVETTEQLQFLRELGCQSAQGCLFGGPVPAEEFTAWLAPGFRKSGHG